jgi:hypothetical protein
MGGELLGIVSDPGDYECPWELLFPAFPGAAGDPGFPALRVGQSSGRAERGAGQCSVRAIGDRIELPAV